MSDDLDRWVRDNITRQGDGSLRLWGATGAVLVDHGDVRRLAGLLLRLAGCGDGEGVLTAEELMAIRKRADTARVHAEANPAWIPPRVWVDRSDLLRHADALAESLSLAEGALADLTSPQSGETAGSAAYLLGVEAERRRVLALLAGRAARLRKEGDMSRLRAYDPLAIADVLDDAALAVEKGV